MVKVFTTNSNGKIEFTKEELEKLTRTRKTYVGSRKRCL
jgi:hypothetical protein